MTENSAHHWRGRQPRCPASIEGKNRHEEKDEHTADPSESDGAACRELGAVGVGSPQAKDDTERRPGDQAIEGEEAEDRHRGPRAQIPANGNGPNQVEDHSNETPAGRGDQGELENRA
ncbi:MAG: hypothetical protein IPJ11_10880 [Gemmatimonadetes bacterium]|nr:hypothetical protein [Gemmatimonadota bacterium]